MVAAQNNLGVGIGAAAERGDDVGGRCNGPFLFDLETNLELVATGRAEIMLDAAMKVWDCAPLQVILEEAGGSFTDWKGTPTIYGSDSVATNAALKKDVLALFNPVAG